MPKAIPARTLHLERYDDLVAEARRIAGHPDAPSRGAWTPAQNVWHVGRVIQASVEGFPARPPLPIRILGPLLKRRYLERSFNPGITLPRQMAGHFIAPAGTPMDQALTLLESSIAKGRAKGFIPASPLFGKLSVLQWEQMHCRHAEMHFGLIELPG